MHPTKTQGDNAGRFRGGPATIYHAEWAWLDGGPAADVLIEVDGGRFTGATAGVAAPPATTSGGSSPT